MTTIAPVAPTAAVKAAPATTPAKPAPTAATSYKKDPRYLALRNFAISMSIFNILGYTLLGFEQPWLWPILALTTGYSAEILLEIVTARVERRRPGFLGGGPHGFMTFLLPAHITSLAVNLLLYGNDRIWPVLFGVIVGITGKAIFRAPIRGRMRHYMNPSNFGITVTLVLFPWVSIAPPYHFTENVAGIFRIFIPMVIITAGTVLNAQLTKKVPLIVGWVGAFVIQALVRWALFDVAILSALSVMTGVAFVLFTNYMITDPGTSPFGGRAQFMFGGAVGAVYGVLISFNIVYTLFFAVTIVCAARGMGWWVVWAASRQRERARARATEPEVVTTALEPEAVPA